MYRVRTHRVVARPLRLGRGPMRKTFMSVAITAAAALLLTSCAMPADDPNFNPDSAGEAIDASAAASASADAASMEAALSAPTSIGVDAPLTAAPAKGATIVSLTDGSEYEGVFETALAEAATALGWTVESVTVDPADPTTAATAFDAALAKKPAGIHITGAFVDSLTDSLAAAQTAGIPVVCTGCSGEPAGGITDTSINGTAQNQVWGTVMASYIASSQYDGEDAAVQVFTLPGGALTDFNTQLNTSLVTQCHNCSTTESMVDPTLTDLSDPAAVAAFVASEMSTSLGSWALLDSGALSSGVADSLAGDLTLLTPVILTGRGAAASDIAALQALSGAAPAASAGASAAASPAASDVVASDATASDAAAADGAVVEGRTLEEAQALQAWMAIPQPVMAWRVVDQFARLIGGDAPATGPLPSQLLTADNAATAVLDESGNYIGVADYQDQFKKLWGVS